MDIKRNGSQPSGTGPAAYFTGTVRIDPLFETPKPARTVGSNIGGIAETQEMLDFCGAHNLTAEVEVIPIQQVNDAYERLLKSEVKYRFSIDMASLRSE